MAFSLRSFFGKGGSSHGAAAIMPPPENMTPAPTVLPSPSAAGPAFPNSMLFKLAATEAPVGAPVALSPFAPVGETPATGLTIGDLLPLVPAEVAKNPGLPSTHPIVLPDSVLESALRSGRASVPLFELFRACPVMFLVPVGPHDPREVPLPPQKIPHLIAGRTAGTGAQDLGATIPPRKMPTPSSAFGIVSAPFETEPAAASLSDAPTTLFNPSPFGECIQTPEPAAETGGATLEACLPHPASPFSYIPAVEQPLAASPFVTASAMTVSSPFSLAPADPAPGPPVAGGSSLFPAVASPFAVAPDAQPSAALPSFPSIFNGPVVQSVPGIGSSSQDSSFFLASPQLPPATPFSQVPADASPFGSAPAANTHPMGAPLSSWGSIFPTHSPAESAAAAMPGVGATFFPVDQPPAAGLSAQAEPAPDAAAAFLSSFGIVAAPAPATVPAASADTVPPPNASLFQESPVKPFNPFERIQAFAKAAEISVPPATDPIAKQPQIDTASLFGGSPLPPAAEPATPAQATMAPSGASTGTGEKQVRLDLAASLKNCAAHDLGTSPENIPSWVQFTLSYDVLADQLSTGRVVVTLDSIVAGLDAPIRALFTQARAGVMVELPSNVVFHAVSEIAPTVLPPMAPETVAAAAPPPPPPLLDPFAQMPDNQWKQSGQSVTPQKPFWEIAEAAASSNPAASFESPPPTEPKPMRTSFIQENPVTPPPPVRNEPVIIPANPLTGAPEFVSPAPVLPPPPPQGPGSFTAAATQRSDNATRRLLLTVLLGSADATDAAMIVKLTRQLPGVAAAFCMNNGRSIAEAGDDSPDARRFLHDAPAKISGLTALASLTGIEDAETLHIRSGQVEATFCLQGAITFAVLHDPRHREPALKEKITLLGREIAAMLGESSAG